MKDHLDEDRILTMSYEDLLRAKTEVDDDIARIKNQIQAAKSRVHAGGDYADPEWYIKATHALRMKGRESQKIQSRIAELRAEERRRNAEKSTNEQVRYCRIFMNVVREHLGEAEYRQLHQEARRISLDSIGNLDDVVEERKQ